MEDMMTNIPTDRPLTAGDYESLADLHTIKGWLHGLATNPDLNDVVADGGVTTGDCYQQEAREFAGRIGRVIAALRARPATSAASEVGVVRSDWPAEREVGRTVYERVEKLVTSNPQPGTSDWAELDYLSHLAESVEEVGGYDGPLSALASPPVSERERGLEGALRTYDAAVAPCPINGTKKQRGGFEDCTLCGASMNENCGLEASASYAFIKAARALIAQPAKEPV